MTTEPALRFPPSAGDDPTTTLVLRRDGDALPTVAWLGPVAPGASFDADEVVAAAGPHAGSPLLVEHARDVFTTPGLRGHRLVGDPGPTTGHDWSVSMRLGDVSSDARTLSISAADDSAGLAIVTEVEALPGGALRARHRVGNTGLTPYLLAGLDLSVPLPDSHTEVLDFSGRHEGERVPARHRLTDGEWLRAGRRGKPGPDSSTLVVVGTPGFGCTHGDVVGVHVGWSGNSLVRVERDARTGAVVGGGELLLPGEVTLAAGEDYRTPWVYVVASAAGLDPLAHALHTWQRSLPAHPGRQPVTLNVWEAVWFDHDLGRLRELADRAARVGVERFVLDDGWFHDRRDDTAGLGDWWVDPAVWPDGLHPLVDHVHELGMEFGLWFEPEMVNPDSDLYRDHPDWVLSAGSVGARTPLLHRHQLVLDLTHPEARRHVLTAMDRVLGGHRIDYVKWDHNRDLLEAGSTSRGGVPAVHEQTLAYYALLDELRGRHPGIAWESCAAGGGRIDLGVLERVQRVWTSDMTDALARQQIQRWTGQLVAPEYLGAHVSAPTAHQTGRTFSLDFRAATALFGAFGIEWDLTTADEDDLDRLAGWVRLFRDRRGLLHSGRVVRPESSDPAVLLHGVVAADRRSALLAHVQLDESAHDRGVDLRVPGLDPALRYEARWEGPGGGDPALSAPSSSPVSGTVLATVGLHLPRHRPETVRLLALEAR